MHLGQTVCCEVKGWRKSPARERRKKKKNHRQISKVANGNAGVHSLRKVSTLTQKKEDGK